MDAASGALSWSIALPAGQGSPGSPAMIGGVIFIGTGAEEAFAYGRGKQATPGMFPSLPLGSLIGMNRVLMSSKDGSATERYAGGMT